MGLGGGGPIGPFPGWRPATDPPPCWSPAPERHATGGSNGPRVHRREAARWCRPRRDTWSWIESPAIDWTSFPPGTVLVVEPDDACRVR